MKTFTNSTTYTNSREYCWEFVTSDAGAAYKYSVDVLKQRWANIGKPEVEEIFETNVGFAWCYAKTILKCRWTDVGRPHIDEMIYTHPFYAYMH